MRTKYSIKNSITSFISNIITFIFVFISQTIFIKILGIEYAGLNGLFSNVLTLLTLFELGIGSAITYSLYKQIAINNHNKIKSLMKFYKKAYNIIALIIFIVGLLIIPFLKFIVKEPNIDINLTTVYILFLISTSATYILSYKRNLLFAYQRNYIINIIHISYIIILNIIQILVIYLTKNYYLYIIVKIICILLENFIINIKANKDYPYLIDKDVEELDKDTKKDITNRVRALFIHKTSNVITHGTDNVLISAFLGLKYVGLYSNYYYIIHMIDNFFRGIITSTTASVGNLLIEKNHNKNYNIFKRIRFLNFYITTFTSVCLFILIEPFITLWLGNKYLLSKFVLIVLIINYFQSMMRSSYTVFKDSAGIWIEDKYIPILQIVLNIVFSIILLKICGLAGVFLGTMISRLVLWFYSYPKFVYKKLFNRSYIEYYKEILKSIIVFSIIIIITYLITNIIVINSSIIKLLVNTVICLVIPNLILYLLFRNKDEFKYYINLFKYFRKKRGAK